MTQAELDRQLAPHFDRIYAAGVAAGRAEAGREREPKSELTPEDADHPERWFAADHSGEHFALYPGRLHEFFSCSIREFAQRSGMRLFLAGDGSPAAWVREWPDIDDDIDDDDDDFAGSMIDGAEEFTAEPQVGEEIGEQSGEG